MLFPEPRKHKKLLKQQKENVSDGQNVFQLLENNETIVRASSRSTVRLPAILNQVV